MINCRVHRVADFVDSSNKRWNENLLNDLCDAECAEDVRRMDMPRCQIEDKLMWTGNKCKGFLSQELPLIGQRNI